MGLSFGRPMRAAVSAVVVVSALLTVSFALPKAAGASTLTFTVVSTGDAGDAHKGDAVCATTGNVCTLRAALDEADALYADDGSTSVTVNFNIPGSGVHVITPGTHLPAVEPQVNLAANTQPGYSAGHPQIELAGSVCGCTGFVVYANGSTISGFDIQGFYRGIYLVSLTAGSHAGATITANFIGTDPTGTTAHGNTIGIDDLNQSVVTIGGSTPAQRNVISGNTAGVYIEPGTSIVWVEGNYIGTNAAGTATLPIRAANADIPGTCAGVDIDDASYVHVGSSTAGTGNLISLGTAEPDSRTCHGIAGGPYHVIDGVRIESSVAGVSAYNFVRGNLIGTDAAGTTALGNETGINLSNAYFTEIGGSSAAARNVISGNTNGIWDHTKAGYTGTVGNYIGTDVTGTTAVPNGTGIINANDFALMGVDFYAGLAGNIISGNTGDGVDLDGEGATKPALALVGNQIGVNATGQPLANGGDGINTYGVNGASVIGGRIANNGGKGVAITNGSQHVRVDASVYANGGLGIDQGGDGVTQNVTNGALNSPVITGRYINDVNTGTEVDGTLNSAPNKSYRIAVYASTVCDGSGYGEGQTRLGDTVVNTDANGQATFVLPNVDVPGNVSLTATSTGPAGTSEFSQCLLPPVFENQGITGGSGTGTSKGGPNGTSYRWIGAADGSGGDNHSWTDPKNWLPSGVPTNGDSVFISQPGGGYCSAYVDSVPTVTLGTLAVSGTANTCGTSLTGGAITVTRALVWDGGTLATPTTVAATAQGTITGASGSDELAAELDIAGAVTLNGLTGQNTLRLDNPQVVHVESGGTLTSEGDNDLTFLSCCNSPAKVVNDGTISAEGGQLLIDAVELDQHATVSTSGAGTVLAADAPVSLGAGATYTGNGAFQLLNSTARLGGTQNVGAGMTFRLGGGDDNQGATLGGDGTFTGAGRVDWAGGEIEAKLTVAAGFHLDIEGPHPHNGDRALGGTDYTGASPVVVTQTNHGTITVAYGGELTAWDSAHLVNASDGTISIAAGSTLNTGGCCVNPSTLVNSGHVNVPSGASHDAATLAGMALQDSGGTVTVAHGERLALTGRPAGSLSATSVSGGGTIAVADPLAVSGTVHVGTATTLELDTNGALDGAATVGGAGKFVWTGGYLSGAPLTVDTTGGITVTGADQKHLGNTVGNAVSTVVLAAPTIFTAGTSRADPNLLDLWQDTLKLMSSTTLHDFVAINSGTLVNKGRLTAAPGASGYVDRGAVTKNYGAITITSGTFTMWQGYSQLAGTTDVAARSTLAGQYPSTAFTVTGGVFEGAGTLSGALVISAGRLSPGGSAVGTLTVDGSLADNAGTTLSLNLSSHGHDVVSVHGPATMGGKITAANASTYRPVAGTAVTVLKAQSVSGSIACTTTSGGGAQSGHWRPAETSTALDLKWATGQGGPAC